MTITTNNIDSDKRSIYISGTLQGEDARKNLIATLEAALEERIKNVYLNIAEVPTVTSSCLGAILDYRNRFKEKGMILLITECNPTIRKILTLLNSTQLLAEAKG